MGTFERMVDGLRPASLLALLTLGACGDPVGAGGGGGDAGGPSSGGGPGGGSDPGWQRRTGAQILDMEVAADGALVVYVLGTAEELASEEPVTPDGNHALVARLSAQDGATEWVHPLPTAYAQVGHLLAAAPNGDVSFPEYDGLFTAEAVDASGAEVWRAPAVSWGGNDFDAEGALWLPWDRITAGTATSLTPPLPFYGWFAAEGYVLYTGSAADGDPPRVAAYELDGTTLRWQVGPEYDGCPTCVVLSVPSVLPDGRAAVYFTVLDKVTNQLGDAASSVTFPCGVSTSSGIALFDADGKCLRVFATAAESPAEINLGMGAAGEELLFGSSLIDVATGEVIRTFGSARTAATPYGQAVYGLDVVPHPSSPGDVTQITRFR